MKNKLLYFTFTLIILVVVSSCAGMREKKAEKHQPFGPHKYKKPHQGNPGYATTPPLNSTIVSF